MEDGARDKLRMPIGRSPEAGGGLEHLRLRNIVARISSMRKAGTAGARSYGAL